MTNPERKLVVGTTVTRENYELAKKHGLKFSALLNRAIVDAVNKPIEEQKTIEELKLKIAKMSELLNEQVKRVYDLENPQQK